MKTALLLSGGMDSLCIAWWKRPEVAITIDYGQLPAQAEIAAATEVCRSLGIEHHVVTIDCASLGSGDLAGRGADSNAPASDWWPYRNQMLLTFAAMKAIGLGVQRLLIGTVRSDDSHRDGTITFVRIVSQLLSMQEGGILVEAPALELSTSQLVRLSGVSEGQLAWAHSCHKANIACGNCRGCNKYLHTLQELQSALDASRQPPTTT